MALWASAVELRAQGGAETSKIDDAFMSKIPPSPTPKFGGGRLIFKRQFIGTPNPYKTQKVRGRNIPPFLLYKS